MPFVSRLEFRVLGPLQVLRDGQPLPLTAPKQRRLLSLMLLRPNAPISQDALIDALWMSEAPRTARAAFQNLVHALRCLLGSETLPRVPTGYMLRAEREALDVERFRRLSTEARRLPALERATKLRQGLALWRGPAFGDLSGDQSAQPETLRLDEERLSALEDRIEADLELGDHAALVPELEQLVVLHPLRERFWFQLVLALYRTGRQADALASFRRAHASFVGGLGIEPGVVLRELQRAILVHDPALDDPTHVLGSTLERAAAILPREPRDRAESLLEYGDALIRLGEFRHAAPALQAAERLAEAAGERGLKERARVLLSYLDVFVSGGNLTAHLQVAESSAAIFERLGDDGGLAFALSHKAHMLRDLGFAERGFACAESGVELAALVGDLACEMSCRGRAAQCAAIGPMPAHEALLYCEGLMTGRVDEVLDESRSFVVEDARAWLLAQLGRTDEARALYHRALGDRRERGLALSLTVGTALAASVERTAGDLDRAADLLRTAYELTRAEGLRADMAGLAGELGCVLALCGELGEAQRLGEESRRARMPGDVWSEVIWRRALALVAAREGRYHEAAQMAEEARDIAERTDWLTFRGETLEDAALVRRLAGDSAGEFEVLDDALALYGRKGNVVGAERVRHALAVREV